MEKVQSERPPDPKKVDPGAPVYVRNTHVLILRHFPPGHNKYVEGTELVHFGMSGGLEVEFFLTHYNEKNEELVSVIEEVDRFQYKPNSHRVLRDREVIDRTTEVLAARSFFKHRDPNMRSSYWKGTDQAEIDLAYAPTPMPTE